MNIQNVTYVLDNYTQLKHYLKLFQHLGWDPKATRETMKAALLEGVAAQRYSQTDLSEWLALHQIDGNNHTFVYNLTIKPAPDELETLYGRRSELVETLWNFTVDTEEGNNGTTLSSIELIGIHRPEGRYIFSFVAPCIVTRVRDSIVENVSQMFFVHAVLFDDSNDLKLVLNPTSRLESVNGQVKSGRNKLSQIADMFFFQLKELLGGALEVTDPKWIPLALHRLADDFSGHNNPEVAEKSLDASVTVREFTQEVLQKTGLDPITDIALFERFAQDVQGSFEAQLIEKFGAMVNGEFGVFRQRSDGVSHTIDVESRQTGLVIGSAAQVARRTRQDADVDLLGIIYKAKEDKVVKLLVEVIPGAYSIRGSNTFIEEEVINVVIRRLNGYRQEI